MYPQKNESTPPPLGSLAELHDPTFHSSVIELDKIGCHSIRITCLCNVYPLEPHFDKAKLVFIWGIPFFFLFLLQTIDCGTRSNRVPTIYVLSKNKNKFKNLDLEKSCTEKFQFFQLKKSLYIAWACFRNVGVILSLRHLSYAFLCTCDIIIYQFLHLYLAFLKWY